MEPSRGPDLGQGEQGHDKELKEGEGGEREGGETNDVELAIVVEGEGDNDEDERWGLSKRVTKRGT